MSVSFLAGQRRHVGVWRLQDGRPDPRWCDRRRHGHGHVRRPGGQSRERRDGHSSNGGVSRRRNGSVNVVGCTQSGGHSDSPDEGHHDRWRRSNHRHAVGQGGIGGQRGRSAPPGGHSVAAQRQRRSSGCGAAFERGDGAGRRVDRRPRSATSPQASSSEAPAAPQGPARPLCPRSGASR